MKILTRCWLVMLGTVGLADARPAFIENVSTITNPNPAVWTDFPRGVAVDGDFALVGAERTDSSNPAQSQIRQTAFLYRRNGTAWELAGQLAETAYNYGVPRNWMSVAMNEGVAVVNTTPMSVYELGPTGWTLSPSDVPISTEPAFDIEIDDRRIIKSEFDCASNAAIITKGTDGVWRKSATLPGATRAGCDNTYYGGAVDISGDWAVVHQEKGAGIAEGEQQAFVFRRMDSGWVQQGAAVVPPELGFFAYYKHAAISGGDVFASAGLINGIYVFRDMPGQGFRVAERIRPVDNAMGGGDTAQMQNSGDLLVQQAYLADRSYWPSVLNVYQRQPDASYEHVAVLTHKGNAEWGPQVNSWPSNFTAISGRTVLAADLYNRVVYHFELPATFAVPAPRQETFNVGSLPDWSASAGSQYRTVRGDRSRVLRQSATDIDTRAIYQPADWTSQAIEVDVKATQFADANGAISLITRYQGPHNYYEFVWGPQRFEFRRMASGTLRTLVSHPGAGWSNIQAGQNRRVRLESTGTRHQVYLDGRQHLSLYSTGPTHGRVGLATYRAAVDFDNVQISPSPLTSIYRSELFRGDPVPLEYSGAGNWVIDWGEDSNVRLVQYSTAGPALVTIGAPAAEQRVEASARVIEFAPPTGTQRRWFGLVARYVDENNHYILALRNSNSLVLTRRLNGVDTTLGNFTVNVVPQQYYKIRLDAVGDQLRAYLDDRLLFETTDTAHPEGNYGLATFKAWAEYESFHGYQP
jgi:hypothetical protein